MPRLTVRGKSGHGHDAFPRTNQPAPAPHPVPFPCVHRGPRLRSLGLMLLCGCDQQVYQCGLLGECVRHAPPELKAGDKLRAAIAEQGLDVCQHCGRREPPAQAE